MALKTLDKVHYPSSDGEPMAETDIHMYWLALLKGRLKKWFAGQRVYVSGNLMIYYQEGDPEKCFSPDGFVVKNCAPHDRDIFKIWEEGRRPNWTMEITSESTRREDLGTKFKRSASLGIKEYFLYDPRAEWLEPPLIGYRLTRGHYEKIEPNPDGGIFSKELGIDFFLDGYELVMKDAEFGRLVLSAGEIATAAEQEAKAARMRADIEQMKAEKADRRAAVESQRAETALRMVKEEKQRAEEAQRRLAELSAEMQRLRQELGRKPNGKK